MIVVDASVILHALIDPIKDPHVMRAIEVSEAQLAPSFVDLEILNGLRKQVLSKRVSERRAAQAIADLAAAPVQRSSLEGLTWIIWKYRHNMTAYDAAYVALAEIHDCPLLTRDLRLKSVAAAHTRVHLL